jgi:hypothetical protein
MLFFLHFVQNFFKPIVTAGRKFCGEKTNDHNIPMGFLVSTALSSVSTSNSIECPSEITYLVDLGLKPHWNGNLGSFFEEMRLPDGYYLWLVV